MPLKGSIDMSPGHRVLRLRYGAFQSPNLDLSVSKFALENPSTLKTHRPKGETNCLAEPPAKMTVSHSPV